MSLQALSNLQIDDYFQNEPKYGGCMSKIEIGRFGKGNPYFYILNMDTSEGPGTHFTLLFMCNPDVGIHFDSFGMAPPEQIVRYMKKCRTENIRNIGIIQDIRASSCGYFACYIAVIYFYFFNFK